MKSQAKAGTPPTTQQLTVDWTEWKLMDPRSTIGAQGGKITAGARSSG